MSATLIKGFPRVCHLHPRTENSAILHFQVEKPFSLIDKMFAVFARKRILRAFFLGLLRVTVFAAVS